MSQTVLAKRKIHPDLERAIAESLILRKSIAEVSPRLQTLPTLFDDHKVVTDPATGLVRLEPIERSAEQLRSAQSTLLDFECFKAADATEEDAVLDFIGSTESKDSYGDIIAVKGWDLKRYKKNPVFMPVHNYGVLPIGRAIAVEKDLEKGALRFRIQFAVNLPGMAGQTARDWYEAYKSKFVRGTSVGFLPLEWKIPQDEEERQKLGLGKYGVYFTKAELLELSAAPVPSNPEALLQNSASVLNPAMREQIRATVIEVLGEYTEATGEPVTPSQEERSAASSTAEDESEQASTTPIEPEPDYASLLEEMRSVSTKFKNNPGTDASSDSTS